ncbi:MAG TPA: hypothetical protein DCF63_18350 [Planctomycetaceae bacterium]|nr:hypothetical protein [Planctomycetaceae bacterium]
MLEKSPKRPRLLCFNLTFFRSNLYDVNDHKLFARRGLKMKTAIFIMMSIALIVLNSEVRAQVTSASHQSNVKSQADQSSETTKSSSMFNGPRLGDRFEFPQWPSIAWPDMPRLGAIKQQASQSASQVRRSTKRWWSNTKELFRGDEEPEPSSKSNSQPSRWWWFSPEPEPEEILTVNEFLRQERPKF